MLRSFSSCLIFLFVFGILSTALYGGEKLPKILIAKDGRSFITENGKPFVPFGVNYFRPGTGWAPQLWKTFDEAAFREDFALMRETGINCVRVFLTYGSFMTEKGKVDPEGLAKFDKLLDIADDYGIYIHPAGPDHWEGPGILGSQDKIQGRFTDDEVLEMTVLFWKGFATRYKGRNTIFAYDLLNEPAVPWDVPSMPPKWNKWLQNRYQSAENFAKQINVPVETINWGNEEAPKDFTNQKLILDYQHFREELADHWTKIQVEAIKSVDPNVLVTVGYIQWSVPTVHPGLQHYAAFKPSRQAPYLDFMEFHFYPLATGFYLYGEEDTAKNLAYVESLAKEVAATGKPVVIAEFGWYGGGQLKSSHPDQPPASEEQQADWNAALIETTKGLAVGWLNWGFFDIPEARDVSELLGLYTVERKPKVWGTVFKKLSERLSGQQILPKTLGPRPVLDWDLLISDPQAASAFLSEYCEAFKKDKRVANEK